MKRVDIFSVLASDAKAVMQMQTKINQWLTAGTFKKVQVHTTGEYIVFMVCRLKES